MFLDESLIDSNVCSGFFASYASEEHKKGLENDLLFLQLCITCGMYPKSFCKLNCASNGLLVHLLGFSNDPYLTNGFNNVHFFASFLSLIMQVLTQFVQLM
jgi:hypothetical protein